MATPAENHTSMLEPVLNVCITRNECDAHRLSLERRIVSVELDIRDIKKCLEKMDSDISKGFNNMQGWILRGLFISVVILISVLIGRSVDFGWML